MKKSILIILFCGSVIFGQAGYAPYDHPVYDFLERMHVMHIIQGYDSFELPKSRKEIAGYLDSLRLHQNKMNQVDKDLLADFISEYEYDVD
jgi:hypothetical protein